MPESAIMVDMPNHERITSPSEKLNASTNGAERREVGVKKTYLLTESSMGMITRRIEEGQHSQSLIFMKLVHAGSLVHELNDKRLIAVTADLTTDEVESFNTSLRGFGAGQEKQLVKPLDVLVPIRMTKVIDDFSKRYACSEEDAIAAFLKKGDEALSKVESGKEVYYKDTDGELKRLPLVGTKRKGE